MNDRYQSPLSERYASKEMQYIFSPDMKFRTWRKLWIALAEVEHELGLNITQEQIDELKKHQDDINYDVAKEREAIVRHDVMSHVYAYGVQCPKAKGIIHLGATSCYVGDNTDIIVMKEALCLVRKKLLNVISELAKFAENYKALPTLAFTHFQPAQPTTVGKRATLWIQELMLDLEDLEHIIGSLKLLGSKGTTGTQASFLELFDGNQELIDKIDPMIAKKMGFGSCYPVSGQTYSRKVDTRVLNVLAGIAASAHKFSNDIRLLQHLKEREKDVAKKAIFDTHYSDVILVFDLDPQDKRFSAEKIQRMSEFFTESSDMGKLYINYPMVEAFYHMKSIPDANYNSYKVTLQELKEGKYKERVNRENRNHDYTKFAVNRTECNTVIKQNIAKAQWLCSVGNDTPINHSKVLQSQLDCIKEQQSLFVLCTCAFYVLDYNPNLLN